MAAPIGPSYRYSESPLFPRPRFASRQARTAPSTTPAPRPHPSTSRYAVLSPYQRSLVARLHSATGPAQPTPNPNASPSPRPSRSRRWSGSRHDGHYATGSESRYGARGAGRRGVRSAPHLPPLEPYGGRVRGGVVALADAATGDVGVYGQISREPEVLVRYRTVAPAPTPAGATVAAPAPAGTSVSAPAPAWGAPSHAGAYAVAPAPTQVHYVPMPQYGMREEHHHHYHTPHPPAAPAPAPPPPAPPQPAPQAYVVYQPYPVYIESRTPTAVAAPAREWREDDDRAAYAKFRAEREHLLPKRGGGEVKEAAVKELPRLEAKFTAVVAAPAPAPARAASPESESWSGSDGGEGGGVTIVQEEGHGRRCGRCNEPIHGPAVLAMDMVWHPHHFVCVVDDEPFEDLTYVAHEGSPYCEAHYHDLFSPRCALGDACKLGGVITDYAISALGVHWHDTCFVCAACGCAFPDGEFYEHDGKPYCGDHHAEMTGMVCAACELPITGMYVAVGGNRYHDRPSCRPPPARPRPPATPITASSSASPRRRRSRSSRARSGRRSSVRSGGTNRASSSRSKRSSQQQTRAPLSVFY